MTVTGVFGFQYPLNNEEEVIEMFVVHQHCYH